jgi:hypothetical protein
VEAPDIAGEHVVGLARITQVKKVLLGGGAAYHGSELRPNPLVPLPESESEPESIVPDPSGCPIR